MTHAYTEIETDIVWDVIKPDIPQLLADLRELSKQVDEAKI